MGFPEYLKRQKNESLDDYLIRLFQGKDNYEIDNYIIARLMNKESGENYSESKWRKDFASFKRWADYFNSRKKPASTDNISYNEKTEIKSDGTQVSDKLVWMSNEDKKDPKFLLEAHGYNSKEWELVSSKSSIWNQHNKQDGTLTLFASKITAKPLKNKFDINELVDKLKNLEPVEVNRENNDNKNKKGLLEVPIFDAHFGISDYDYYKETQQRILDKIESNNWEEILFVIGQDLLHNDGFTSQTTKGTIIEQVDMEKAWEDASRFYIPMIKKSIEHANNVKVIYSAGNHDEAMSWAFVQMLKARFPDCTFDDSLQEHKLHVYGKNAIGLTHGDKGGQRARNEIHNVFAALFPVEWGQAKNREIHMGHFHREDLKDKFGTMVRTLATRNKTDEWHKKHGFVGAHKRFMIFEYSKKELNSITYV